MVFYLKYRPQTLKDLDSGEVRERLIKVLSSNSIPHAFLFTGPKGLGKTSTARIIAKSVNCLKKKTGEAEPCDKCESCISIQKGTNLDVLEIDAASNRGIDEIRDLREKIRLSPVSSKKKVYIIDEVHMLTTEAFNALLKTLEEPPEHALFVLCTTEPHKVPETIVSRCVHISFNSPTDSEMKRSLKRVIDGEKLSIDDSAYNSIVKLSNGSFRDGAKIMEEISLNFGTKRVTGEDIDRIFNLSDINQSIPELILSVIKKDVKKSLSIIDSLTRQKADIKYFNEQLLTFLHSILLHKLSIPDNAQYKDFIEKNDIPVTDLKKLIQIFSTAYQDIRFAVIPQIPIEIAIIDYCASVSEGEEQIKTETLKIPKKTEESIVPNDGNILSELIEKVNLKNHSAAGLLRGVKLEEDGKKLVLSTSYKFHKEKLEDPQIKELIIKSYKDITRKDKDIEINLRG